MKRMIDFYLVCKCMILTFIILTSSCNPKHNKAEVNNYTEIKTVKTGNEPSLKFEKEKHNFGTISDKEKVMVSFNFRNNGETPLIIQKVTTS